MKNRWIVSAVAGAVFVAPTGARSAVDDELSPTVQHRTEHYLIHYEGVPAEVEELGTVLELAFDGLERFFGRSPRVKKKEPLEIRVYADREEWLAGLAADGAVPPPGLALLWFRPENTVVYLYRQRTPWLTRWLVLHGACQQFHYRAQAKNRDLAHHWYVTGIAEYLAIHRWDGRRLELGAHPLISSNDLAAQALDGFESTVAGLRRLTAERLREPAISWAMVGFLLEGSDEKYERRFRKYALGSGGSKLTGEQFAWSLGDPGEFVRELQVWLESVQAPLRPVWGEWEDVGGETIGASTSARCKTAVALRKDAGVELSATVRSEGGASAGLVLGWVDEHDYTTARVEGSRLLVERVLNGAKRVVLREILPLRGCPDRRIRVVRGDPVMLEVDGERVAEIDVEGDVQGLFVHDGTALFRDVEWR